MNKIKSVYLCTYTRICVCLFVFVLYCRFQAHTKRMVTLVKEIVTEASNEISNWSLKGQDRPPYLKKKYYLRSPHIFQFSRNLGAILKV